MSSTDDRISAHLDGELLESEQQAFSDEVAASVDLQRGIEQISAARSMVRSLPAVEPPAHFLDRLATAIERDSRRRNRVRPPRWVNAGAAALVSAAALWLLVLGLGWASSIGDVSPQLEALALRHGDGPAASDSFASVGSEDMVHMDEPVRTNGVTLVAAYRSQATMQFVYDTGGGQVSVFRQMGHLAMRDGPTDLEPMNLGGMAAYTTEMYDTKVVVVDAGDAVLTVVGDMAETDRVMAVASSVSVVDQNDSVWSRTRRGWDQLTNAVGL